MQTNNEYLDLRIIGLLGALFAGLLLVIFPSRYSNILPLLYFASIIGHGVFYGLKQKKTVLALFIPLLYLLEHTGLCFWFNIGIRIGKIQTSQEKTRKCNGKTHHRNQLEENSERIVEYNGCGLGSVDLALDGHD